MINQSKKPLIILTGPTAVGKTALSIALAKKINGEIISADSMQVYRKMDIGSAKIKPEQMQGVPHYMIDILDPKESFHVVEFQKRGNEYIQEIYEKGKIPIIVGGTGFYIQALLYNIDFTENDEDKPYRKELEALAKANGNLYLHHMLQEVDPESAKTIHYNNVKRVIRALEFYKETGIPISLHNEEQKNHESPFSFKYFVLNHERQVVYDRIDKRVDEMLKEGLVDEVKDLLQYGCTKDMVSMQGLGYKQIANYLDGSVSYEQAVYEIKRDTRHFAKRQITWFKRERDVIWVQKDAFKDDENAVLEYMLSEINDIICTG